MHGFFFIAAPSKHRSGRYPRAHRRIPFADIGFNLYSDTDEDGILLYIFAAIGIRQRVCVDIGAAGILARNEAISMALRSHMIPRIYAISWMIADAMN